MSPSNFKSNKGAALLEYAVILSILIGVFVVLGLLLQYTAVVVAKRSVDTVRTDVPCSKGENGNSDSIFKGEQCF